MENCTPSSVRVTPYTRCQGRWRKRPNHELEYLRQQVVNLEEELAVLRQPDKEPSRSLELGDGETWECLAARLRAKADAALAENIKLQSLLEGQLKVARTLETAIDQHWKRECKEKAWFTGEAERPRACSLSDELIYALLEEDLENQYARVDKVLEASGITRVVHELVPVLRTEHSGNGISFYHSDARLLPFSVSSVVHALYNLLSHGEAGQPMKRCQKLWKGDDHLRATTSVKLQLPNARNVEVKTRLVQRLFHEVSRTVFVYAAYVEIEGSMFVRLEEKGWITLEPHHIKKRSRILNIPACIMHSIVRVAPVPQFSSAEDEREHVGELTDLVVDAYQRNFGLLYQVLENLILDTAND
ncbi:unnamed protein product [Phytophthora lilii]|uniref:Unnamed protein product n=1 Tax=Phytophthora lilii TaxID=2077276 RepID=A0A9W6WZR1_9STRA|nr:unnamed protein product [Phytophthora lilii]